MKTIHQLVHTLSYGDAISCEVLSLKKQFNDLGIKSEVYAINEHPKLKGESIKYTELDVDFDGEVILHYSLGSPLNDLYSKLTKAKRALIYHNLTPPKWFKGTNPRIVRDIEAGVKELPELLKITDRIISDSKYNAKEIEALGFESSVLELPVDPQRWQMESNSGIVSQLQNDPSIHLIHVGRLAPNKCVEDIIKTFYFLHEKVTKDCKLWLVGIDIDTEVYSYSLKRLVNFLGLEDKVKFVGCFADSELKALYENATVYLCMSEHEGFCLPVVEAMRFGLPVLSYASSALPDTVGGGGILFSEKNHLELALLINEIATNPSLKEKLIASGKKRVENLSVEVFKDNVKELFS